MHSDSFDRLRLVTTLFVIFGVCVGCGRNPNARELGVGAGAALGAGLGAIVGNQTGSTGAGIAIGAASGALVGGLIGNESENLSTQAAEQDERLRRQQEELERQRRELEDLRRQEYYDSSYRSGNSRVYGDTQKRLDSAADEFKVPVKDREAESAGSDPRSREGLPGSATPEPSSDRTGYERY